jgi:iron complex transport system substrate-binding protein
MQASCGLVILTAACALSLHCIAAAEPITVRDAFDRAVTVPAPPQRIVTIFASNTEMLAALGLIDRIVGIEAYTRYPPEILDRPLVGGRLGFSVDAVVRLRPDLVVVTPARQAAHQLVNIRLLGRAAGVSDRGEQLARSLEDRLASTMQRVKGRTLPRVVMITGRLGNGLLLVTRPGTYTGDAIELAGGRSHLRAVELLLRCRPRRSCLPIRTSCSTRGRRRIATS